jgi:hypothetical protein
MSRLSAVAAALLALIFAAFPVACTDVDPSNPYDPSAPNTVQARATVTGRVLLETGEPAAGAEVGLQEASISGRSSEDGAFRLDDVPAGGYTLTATLPGYVVGTRIVFDLARGESRDVGTLTLARATGRIVGTLSVGGGLDVDLRSIRLGVDFGPASPSVDATGAFALEGVYAGERTLTASLPGFADATARVTVAADAAVTAPALVLEAVPVPVTVDVTAPPGFAAGDTPLALTATMNGRAQTVPVVEGTARFDAPHAGLLALSVSHPVLARFERTVQVAPGLDPSSPVALTPISLSYAQGGLRGQVDTADCAPTGVAVLVTATGRLTGATAAVPVSVPGADTDGCGQGVAYELAGLRADDYLLTFTAEAYRPGVAADAVEVREETFAQAAPVILDVATGAVRGRVVVPADAGDPGFSQAGTRVELAGTAFSATTDPAGDFLVEGVRPGAYAITLRRDGETWQPLRLPSVSVRPLETVDLGELGLSFATGSLSGRIELSTGEDPSTVTVSLSGPESGTANPDATGVYQFLGRRTGVYRITARHPDFTTAEAEATLARHLEAIELAPLRLEVAPATIEGNVVFEPNALGTLPRVTVGATAVDVLADGSFRVDGLRRGTYTVTVDYPPTHRSKSLPGILATPGSSTVLSGISLERAAGTVEAVFTLADEDRFSLAAVRALRSSIQVSLNSQTGGLSYSSLADENGQVRFGSVLVDTYTLSAALDDYLPYRVENIEVAEDGDERSLDGELALPVNPGSIRGAVRYADRVGPQVDRISIRLSGLPDVFEANAEGSFALEGLRAGIYSVTFTGSAAGYRPVTVSPVVVAAGAETQMAETALPVAYGAVAGTVRLEQDDEFAEVIVTLTHEDGDVRHALVDGLGRFTFSDVRTGTYIASARHPLYLEGQEDGLAVVLDEQTEVDFFLQLHRGALRGVARPSDQAAAGVPMTATLQQTGETVRLGAEGDFEFRDLRAGVYSVDVSAEGHQSAQSLPVTVGPGETVDLDEVLLLIDETAPDAPVLVACDGAEPLPDFPDSPVVIPVAANLSAPFSVRLKLTNDPTTDANFDPAANLGSWQWRVGGGDWRTLEPASFVLGPPGDPCGDHFVVSVGAANTIRTLEIRAEDADRNRSDSGILVALVDSDAPAPFSVGVPQGQCNMVAAAADAPRVQLPMGGRNGQPAEVQRDPVPLCHTSHDTVDLLIAPPALDPTFGCYFLYSRTLGQGESPTAAVVQADLLDASGAIDLENVRLDTTACYQAGAQAIAVSPTDGQRTLYCVVGVDQSGRYAPFAVPQSCRGAPCPAGQLCNPRTFACETPIGTEPGVPASMLGCLIVNRDTAVPQSIDLLPDGVEITGGQVRLHTIGLPASRDPHFSRLEYRGGVYGENWRTAAAELTTFSDRGLLTLRVAAGESSTLSVRAVDLAGNVSDETRVSVDDVTQRPAADDAAALGSSPGIVGERTAWVGPAQCDPQGQAKTCSHVLRSRDESQLVPTVSNLGTLQSCAYDCVSDATRTPRMVLLPRGLAYTHYVTDANGADARLMYRTFGADGLPGTADDPAPTEMGGANTVFEGIVALAANERQVAYATLTDPDRDVAGNETYVIRRFTVNELTGIADAEQTLAALPQRATITSAVVAVAPPRRPRRDPRRHGHRPGRWHGLVVGAGGGRSHEPDAAGHHRHGRRHDPGDGPRRHRPLPRRRRAGLRRGRRRGGRTRRRPPARLRQQRDPRRLGAPRRARCGLSGRCGLWGGGELRPAGTGATRRLRPARGFHGPAVRWGPFPPILRRAALRPRCRRGHARLHRREPRRRRSAHRESVRRSPGRRPRTTTPRRDTTGTQVEPGGPPRPRRLRRRVRQRPGRDGGGSVEHGVDRSRRPPEGQPAHRHGVRRLVELLTGRPGDTDGRGGADVPPRRRGARPYRRRGRPDHPPHGFPGEPARRRHRRRGRRDAQRECEPAGQRPGLPARRGRR